MSYVSWLKNNSKFTTLPSIVCWILWIEQNLVTFEGRKDLVFLVIAKVTALTPLVVEKKHKKRYIQPLCILTSFVCWVYGASSPRTHGCGAGGINKINAQRAIKWIFNCGHGTITRAYLIGVWVTLFLAKRLNIEVIQVIGDSNIILDWLKDIGKL